MAKSNDDRDDKLFGSSEEHYHRMVEEVEDYAILLLDREGIVRNWNKGAEKIKGYKAAEIVGRHFRVFYTEEDRIAALPEKLMREAVLNGKAVHEGWRMRKDGTAFWGSIVITTLHGDDGGVIGFSKVTRDLTARKLAEDKLVRYARLLEAQNRELQQFTYAAAHDMKEPLRKIQFYNSMVIEESPGTLSPKQQLYLERSSDAAARMQRLIEDLLAYTKISEPGSHFEPVDLEAMVVEVTAFYQEALDKNKGVLESSSLPAIQGVPFQIRQLFLNLFGNSIKYSAAGRSLRIEVECNWVYNPELGKASGSPLSRYLQLTIKDNGIGFEQEHNERIFDMFERLHGKEHYAGTGIGLAICRKIMENHRGFIRAKGYPGEGAVFELYFPA